MGSGVSTKKNKKKQEREFDDIGEHDRKNTKKQIKKEKEEEKKRLKQQKKEEKEANKKKKKKRKKKGNEETTENSSTYEVAVAIRTGTLANNDNYDIEHIPNEVRNSSAQLYDDVENRYTSPPGSVKDKSGHNNPPPRLRKTREDETEEDVKYVGDEREPSIYATVADAEETSDYESPRHSEPIDDIPSEDPSVRPPAPLPKPTTAKAKTLPAKSDQQNEYLLEAKQISLKTKRPKPEAKPKPAVSRRPKPKLPSEKANVEKNRVSELSTYSNVTDVSEYYNETGGNRASALSNTSTSSSCEVPPLPTRRLKQQTSTSNSGKTNIEKKPSPPPERRLQGIQAVLAIDFGTTFSGYAYSHMHEKDKIMLNDNWFGHGGQSYKTPTCVTINQAGAVEKFGYEAQNQFFGGDGENEQDTENLSYFENFKLELMSIKEISEHKEIQTDYGKPINAIQLFALVIKYIKDKAFKKFHEAGKNYGANNIRWVLTVPAIWEDPQKLLMRLAAKQAGLIEKEDSDNLQIALEPEAASLYCRSLKMNGFQDCAGEKMVSLTEDSIYMVVDAGGGTIDITVHQVLSQDKTTELTQARGGPWGGSKVNGRFELKMISILGEDFVKYCKSNNPVSWLELMREFEMAKQTDAASPKSQKSLILKCGLGLSNTYYEFKNEKLSDALNTNGSGISMNKNGHIVVDRENIRTIFSTVVVKTTNLLDKLFSNTEIAKTKIIFIVGGFGQCPYLQEEIKSKFETHKRQVLIPEEGNLCVLRGAVMIGHKSDFISSRVAKCSYLYLTTREYDPSRDDEKKRYPAPNDNLIPCLLPIIQKGDHVGIDEEIRKDFLVENEEFSLDIYASDKRDVEDPDSDDVTKMGALKINLPISRRKSKLGQSEKVRVEFTLGTELKVKGTHLASNTTTETSLSLLD